MKKLAHENKTQHMETAPGREPMYNVTADNISSYSRPGSTQCDATKNLTEPKLSSVKIL